MAKFGRRKEYLQLIEEKKKNPALSIAAECRKRDLDYGYYFVVQRQEKGQGPGKAPPKPPSAPPPQRRPEDKDLVYIPVPKSELVDMVIHKRHSIVIPADKVFQALPVEVVQELDSLVGKAQREAALKQPEEVGLSGGGSKKGGLLNKGG